MGQCKQHFEEKVVPPGAANEGVMRTKTTSVTVRKLSPSGSECLSTLHQSSCIAHFVNCHRFSTGHRSFLAAVTAITEPRSFKQAMKDPDSREVMEKEIQASEDNRTWRLWRLFLLGNMHLVVNGSTK